MTYYSGKELAASFRQVRGNTIQIAEDIPESKYDYQPTPDTDSIAKRLVHIAVGPRVQYHIQSNKIDDMTKVDFQELIESIRAEAAKPRNKAQIVAFLKSEGEKFATYLESLPEAFLAERVRMPPGAEPAGRSRFEMLLSPKEHEMHHRGQLMLVERIIGIVPHLTRQFQERMATQQAQQAQPAQR